MKSPNDENKPTQPPNSRLPSAGAVTIKTMFYTEGNPAALIVKTIGGKRTKELMAFDTAELALAWCRKHGSNLYYTAITLANQ